MDAQVLTAGHSARPRVPSRAPQLEAVSRDWLKPERLRQEAIAGSAAAEVENYWTEPLPRERVRDLPAQQESVPQVRSLVRQVPAHWLRVQQGGLKDSLAEPAAGEPLVRNLEPRELLEPEGGVQRGRRAQARLALPVQVNLARRAFRPALVPQVRLEAQEALTASERLQALAVKQEERATERQ